MNVHREPSPEVFDRLRAHYLDDDEYGELQQFMMRNRKPEPWFAVPAA
jgi:hypothetical protein